VRLGLRQWNHADLSSGFDLLPSPSAWLRGLSFFVFGEFFRELSAPVSGERFRDPALRRLIRKLDSISLRFTPRERFVCRMRLRFSDEQVTRAVAGAAMQLIMSARSEL
jgi:hypothetical protein